MVHIYDPCAPVAAFEDMHIGESLQAHRPANLTSTIVNSNKETFPYTGWKVNPYLRLFSDFYTVFMTCAYPHPHI